MQKNHISLYLPSFGYCNACPSEVVPVSANCSRIFYPQASSDVLFEVLNWSRGIVEDF